MVDLGLMGNSQTAAANNFLELISISSNGYQSTDTSTLKWYAQGGNYAIVPGGGTSCFECTGCPVSYDLPNFYSYITEIFVNGTAGVSIGMHQTWIDLITAINNSGIITTVITTSMNHADVNTLLWNEATGYNVVPQIVSDINACGCTVSSPGDPGSPGGIACTEVIGTGGEYQTEQLCLDAGCATSESWTCYDGNCINPGDGSGVYSTYCDCVTLTPTSQSTSKVTLPQFCCNEGEGWLYTCQNIPSPTTLVYGCMDDGTTNDPFITQQRPNGWVGPATNYSLAANVSDCSCIYTVVESWDCDSYGNCDDPGTGNGMFSTWSACDAVCGTPCLACNAPLADNTIPGCCGAAANNYNPLATCDDGSCEYPIYGCTDPTACNFYAGATVDDGSCFYPTWNCDNGVCVEQTPCLGTGTYYSLPQCQNLCASVVTGTIDCATFLLNFEGCGDYNNFLAGTSSFNTLSDLAQHWYDILINAGYTNNLDGTPLTLMSVQLLLEECCCVPTLNQTNRCDDIYSTWLSGTYGPAPNHVYSPTQLYYPNQTVSYIDPAVGIVNYFIASPASGGNFTPSASSTNPQLYPPPTAGNIWSGANVNGYWEGCEVIPC
tara:strand:- start:1226 stop:3040 length:1815 start_codon:yes stop_codon:yes gene_type:complete